MARNWSALSAGYRERLKKAGITQEYYESGGGLHKARGHGETPEHPAEADRNPKKYSKYRNSRNYLTRKVIARKKLVFGGMLRFHEMHSRDYVVRGVPHLAGWEQRPPSIGELKDYLAASDDQLFAWASEAQRIQAYQYSPLWYH